MKIAVLIIIALMLGLRIYRILAHRKKSTRNEKSTMCAQVMCGGTNALAKRKYNYDGVRDCRTAAMLYDGPKLCTYGCVGMGTCASVCPQNAINIIGGVAAVDRSKCIACGKCIDACPKHIIRLVPATDTFWTGCSNRDNGDTARTFCKMACISCGECATVCPKGAITVKNNLASIDHTLCDGCGKCAEVCPQKTIWKA